MQNLPGDSKPKQVGTFKAFNKARVVSLFVFAMLLTVCLTVLWMTRDAMAHMPFLARGGRARSLMDRQKTLVDLTPWQSAQALAPLAVSAEEADYAREAERLADHEVVQAFASELRKANFEAAHRVLTGEALTLSKRVDQLQQLVKQDQAQVNALTPVSGSSVAKAAEAASAAGANSTLEIAQAQLDLDTDQLADAQQDLERAAGDNRAEIQSELAAHQAAMTKSAAAPQGDHSVAIVSAAQRSSLVHRIAAWGAQNERYGLIQQALQEAQADAANLTAQHNALEVKADASVSASTAGGMDEATKLADMREAGADRQILSILDDRIQTEQQLAGIYSKWSAQVQLQHRILLHLIMRSLALGFGIVIATLFCDALMRKLLAHPVIDRRQMHTLRTIVELGVQVIGGGLVLLVIFGPPQQLSTVLGLATAGLTIALQDFILAFCGWFLLMGKGGIRVGDWVEINKVAGEVTEIGLMNTTLMETGDMKDRGHPTGRETSFLNNFAIRGQYFNFSTLGQWMWDDITVTLPPAIHSDALVESIHQLVMEETAQNARVAEKEWKRGKRDDGFGRFSASPVVILRPSVAGVMMRVRYVTRASERLSVRNRIYKKVVDLMQEQRALDGGQQALETGE